MKSKSVPVYGMSAAFGVALALAAAILATRGADEKSLRLALDATARWSFLLFWLAYAGGALVKLFGPGLAPLARGREFGLAFASAHLVHIGLIVWLGGILHHAPLQGGLLIFFLVAIGWTYLLAALSFGGLSRVIGPWAFRLIMLLGLNYILLAFARDFILGATDGWGKPGYLWQFLKYAPFAALCIAAPLLRFAAAARKQRQPSAVPP
jgi:hypothetical protein